ncbi:MAG: metallophosphoesterase [Deltaproteobacteria bacterium]|nr:metallophosphoesterase [Deltaproteobacteria bacterium]
MITRRTFLKLGAATALTAGAATVVQAAPQRLRISRHRIPWPVGRRLKIAHLTDVHVGWGTPKVLLRQAAARAREARPDLTVLTGDYLNHSLDHLFELRAWLRLLPRPCVATLGNHDHWSGADAISRALVREGVLVLRNNHKILSLGGTSLPVVGVDDGLTKHADPRRAFSGLVAPERALVLTHVPDTAPSLVAHGARLVLAGHTHGGQVYVPKISEALARVAGHAYLAGWYRVGPTLLYVNAGVGSSAIRLRAGRKAQPELALFELSAEIHPRRSSHEKV